MEVKLGFGIRAVSVDSASAPHVGDINSAHGMLFIVFEKAPNSLIRKRKYLGLSTQKLTKEIIVVVQTTNDSAKCYVLSKILEEE